MLKVAILFSLFLSLYNCCAQDKRSLLESKVTDLFNNSAKLNYEKVHLHLNQAWYTQGDTIWFKAYTVAGESHQLSSISKVLYVELINDKDYILKRCILHMDPGICWGDIVLPYTYQSGDYHLRAYTNWMRNDSTYVFDQLLHVGSLRSAGSNTITADTSGTIKTKQVLTVMPDVQFMPEGGELISGLRSKITFKVLNNDGSAGNISGIVVDKNNKQVAVFKTQHSGMGAFYLQPQRGTQYIAKILSANRNSYEVKLPPVKDEGFSLSVNYIKDSLVIKVAVNNTHYKNYKNLPFYILAQVSGKAYFTASGKLVDTAISIPVARQLFPSGIVQITLFSDAGEPMNERLVFLQNNDQLNISLSLKPAYKRLEKLNLNISTNNTIQKPAQGSFSVSVTDNTQLPVDEAAENTIFTDLLLNADLQGKIEKPNYYFQNTNDTTLANLDLLMLTQGFRKFSWKKTEPKTSFAPETELVLNGKLNTPANMPATGAFVRLTSIKDKFAVDTIGDINGRFIFKDIDLLDTTKVVINTLAKESNNFAIYVNEPTYLPVNYKNTRLLAEPATVPPAILSAMLKAYNNFKLDSLGNVKQLSEVVIKGRKKKPHDPVYSSNMQYSSNLNGPGRANQIIMGTKLVGCPQLQQCLATNLFGVTFQPDILGTRVPYSTRSAANHIIGKHPMAIFVDGIQIGPETLSNYTGDDVYSVEVLTSASNLAIYGSNAPNGAIIITLKHGSDNTAGELKRSPKGIITYNYKGYSKVREFYSPQYNNANPLSIGDKRKTIYWNPNIITDPKGNASFEFFNANIPGTYRVVVEGIDGYGSIGRKVLSYKVE